MYGKLKTALLLLPFPSIVMAQKLGFVAGPSLDYGILSKVESGAVVRPVPLPGLHAGMHFEYDVTNRWGFDIQVMYAMRTQRWVMSYPSMGSLERTMDRLTGYLDVPFHFYVNVPLPARWVFNIFGGPVFTCGLHGHDWAFENTALRKPVNEAYEKIFDKDDGRITRCEFALEAGFAFKCRAYQARISYQHSVNNSTHKNFCYTLPLQSAPYLTNGELKLSFVYLFDLRK